MTELEQQGPRLPAERTTTPPSSQPQKPDPFASGRVIINAPGLYLVSDRLLSGARKWKSEALRHREMFGAIEHSAPERTETP
jgi:hypothetical protein